MLMTRHRISQEALAKVLGIHQTTLGTRLRGETAFDVDELAKLAKHFDVQVSELLPRDAA